jgi:hypothetical protein
MDLHNTAGRVEDLGKETPIHKQWYIPASASVDLNLTEEKTLSTVSQ